MATIKCQYKSGSKLYNSIFDNVESKLFTIFNFPNDDEVTMDTNAYSFINDTILDIRHQDTVVNKHPSITINNNNIDNNNYLNTNPLVDIVPTYDCTYNNYKNYSTMISITGSSQLQDNVERALIRMECASLTVDELLSHSNTFMDDAAMIETITYTDVTVTNSNITSNEHPILLTSAYTDLMYQCNRVEDLFIG